MENQDQQQGNPPAVSACPDCGGMVSRRVDVCPHCGCPDVHGAGDDAPQAEQAVLLTNRKPTPNQATASEGELFHCSAGHEFSSMVEPSSCPFCGSLRVSSGRAKRTTDQDRNGAPEQTDDEGVVVDGRRIAFMLGMSLVGFIVYAIPKFVGSHIALGAMLHRSEIRRLERLGELNVWSGWEVLGALGVLAVVPAAIFWFEKKWPRDAIVRLVGVAAVGAVLAVGIHSGDSGRLAFAPVYLAAAVATYILFSVNAKTGLLLVLPLGYGLFISDFYAWAVPCSSSGRAVAATLFAVVLIYAPLPLIASGLVQLWRGHSKPWWPPAKKPWSEEEGVESWE